MLTPPLPDKWTGPSRPSSLTLLLISARSGNNNKYHLIHDVIGEEDADLACIKETWAGDLGWGLLSFRRGLSPGYTMQHQGRLERWDAGAAIVYGDRTISLSNLECLLPTVGRMGRFGVATGHSPHNPAGHTLGLVFSTAHADGWVV